MARTIDKQTRKVGDTLRLSGILTGDTLPLSDAAWVGAVAVINIVKKATGAAYRLNGAVQLDVVAVPRRYLYAGAPPAQADIGEYTYEVQVTYADNSITTHPNNTDRYELEIVAQLG